MRGNRLFAAIGLAVAVFVFAAGSAVAKYVVDAPDLPSTGEDPLLPALPLPPKPGDPSTPQRPLPNPALGPKVGAAGIAAAKEVIAADPVLRSVLGDRIYVPTEFVPWVVRPTVNDHQVVGADVKLSLSRPLSTSTPLPAADFHDDGTYEKTKLHAKIENATGLHVLVDLRTSEVVRIRPNDAAKVSELPGNTYDTEDVGK